MPDLGPATARPETLTLAGAQLIVEAALAQAAAMSGALPGICVAAVDAGTHLLHFARTPGGKTTSVQTAIDKAFTAAGHRQPTAMYAASAAFQPGGPAEGIGRTNTGRFCTIPGGVPVLNARGETIGAIGASSGTPAQDEQVVRAGIAAWDAHLRREGRRPGAKL